MKLKLSLIVLLSYFIASNPVAANWFQQGTDFSCETEAECLLLMGNPWPLDPKNDSQLRRMFYFFGLEEPQLFNTVINIRDKICNVVGGMVDKTDLPCLENRIKQGYNGYVKNADGVMVTDPMPVEWGLAKHWFPEAYQMSGPAYHGQGSGTVGFLMNPVGSTFWGTNKERLYSMTMRFAEKQKAPVYTLKKPFQVTQINGIFGPVGALEKGTTEIFESDEFWPRFEWRHTRKKDGRLEKKNLPKFIRHESFGSQECGVIIKSPGLHMGFEVSGFKVGICIEANHVILSGISATNNQIGIRGKNFVIVDSYIAYNKMAGIKGHHFLSLNNVINKNTIGIDVDYSGAGGPASVFYPKTNFQNNITSVPFKTNIPSDYQLLLKTASLPQPMNLTVNADQDSWDIKGFLNPKGLYQSKEVTAVVFRTTGGDIVRQEKAQLLVWPVKPEKKTVSNAKGELITTWNDVTPLPFSVSLPKSEEEGALQAGDKVIVQLYPGDWSVIDEPKPDSPYGWMDYYDSVMESFVAVTSGQETPNASSLGINGLLKLPEVGGVFPTGSGGAIVPK